MKALKLVAILGFSILALGQAPAQLGSITGTVRDESGAPLPGVTVTAVGPAAMMSAISDTNASYTLSNLPAGTYSVSASLPGFAPVRQSNVSVGTAAARVDFALRVQGTPRQVLPVPRSPRERDFDIVSDTQTTQGGSILYRGNVRMTTEAMRVYADELDFNTATLSGAARGNVRVQVLPVTPKVIPLTGR